MKGGFTFNSFIKHIKDVVSQPELHMREIPILVGITVLIIFIILVVVAIFLVKPHESKPVSIDKEKFEKSIKRRYIALAIFGVLAMVFLGITWNYSSKPEFCLSCHKISTQYDQMQKSAHKDVTCQSCHRKPGFSGIFLEKIELLEMGIANSKVIGDVRSAHVTNEACLGCHEDVLIATRIVGNIRVEHKEPFREGYACTDCHFSKPLFHSKMARLEKNRMGQCINCHNQKKASANCSQCHVDGTWVASKIRRPGYSKVDLSGKDQCKSCHAMSLCLNCHKLQMPHQEKWKANGHSMQAFTAKKLCMECHDQGECLKCHAGTTPHGENWVKKHGPKSKKPKDPCSLCHRMREFCTLCHTDVISFRLRPVE